MKTRTILIATCLVLLPMLAGARSHKKVWTDATRLAALLSDAQNTASIGANTWRVVGNEANVLANRIYAGTAGNATARRAARDLRTHVRQFREAALKGDADAARTHAAEAQPFLYRIIDWSM